MLEASDTRGSEDTRPNVTTLLQRITDPAPRRAGNSQLWSRRDFSDSPRAALSPPIWPPESVLVQALLGVKEPGDALTRGFGPSRPMWRFRSRPRLGPSDLGKRDWTTSPHSQQRATTWLNLRSTVSERSPAALLALSRYESAQHEAMPTTCGNERSRRAAPTTAGAGCQSAPQGSLGTRLRGRAQDRLSSLGPAGVQVGAVRAGSRHRGCACGERVLPNCCA